MAGPLEDAPHSRAGIPALSGLLSKNRYQLLFGLPVEMSSRFGYSANAKSEKIQLPADLMMKRKTLALAGFSLTAIGYLGAAPLIDEIRIGASSDDVLPLPTPCFRHHP